MCGHLNFQDTPLISTADFVTKAFISVKLNLSEKRTPVYSG